MTTATNTTADNNACFGFVRSKRQRTNDGQRQRFPPQTSENTIPTTRSQSSAMAVVSYYTKQRDDCGEVLKCAAGAAANRNLGQGGPNQ